MARFDNKVVLVSGGARGQGAAEARLLVAQGAKVVIGDVLDNQGQTLAAELGPAASFVRHDVTSEADWARAVETAQKLGGLHGLVNNAGIYQPAALMETDDALWQRHIQINQYGCFLGMKAVVPAMERSGGGSIVNISSCRADGERQQCYRSSWRITSFRSSGRLPPASICRLSQTAITQFRA
jgi:3alpha(or 20beta)-hydroxysteroid dehydrogenase